MANKAIKSTSRVVRSISMSETLHGLIEKSADKNKRTFISEAELRLEQSFLNQEGKTS